MSRQEYDYGDEFVEVKRHSHLGHPQYGAEQETDRDFASLGQRRAHRERADSVNFTPHESYGVSTHSEAGDSGDDQAYFSTKHHQFESSFRSIRGRERAPLAPRVWAMTRGEYNPTSALYDGLEQAMAFDNEVELRELPVEQQELAIVDDILSLLIGVSGRYITFRSPAHSTIWRRPISIEDALIAPMWINPTLAQMANKILPLVLMHRRVEYFVAVYAGRQAGVVSQALCAAINSILKDYYDSISTIENLERTSTDTDPYTLQQLWYHLYPNTQMFERLVHLVDEIQKKDLPQVEKVSTKRMWREDDGFTTKANGAPSTASETGEFPGENRMIDPEADDSDEDGKEPSELFMVRGGYMLNVISDMIRLRGGDSSTKQLYELLLIKASAPFLQMLDHWLRTGELEDSKPGSPGGEFMVAKRPDEAAMQSLIGAETGESEFGDNLSDDPTHVAFVSVPDLTPAFLRPYAEKIVRTGEYLNILRACGVDLRSLDNPDIGLLSLDNSKEQSQQRRESEVGGLLKQQQFTRQIDQAYLRANQALLDVLFKDGQMMAYMGAVKRYLLFETSDFLTHFLDQAKLEMNRRPEDISTNRLQSFLDLALLNPASVSHDDPLKDIVEVAIESADLIETMNAINMDSSAVAASQSLVSRRAPKDVPSSGTFFSKSVEGDDYLSGDQFTAFHLQIPFPYTVVLDKEALDKYTALNRLLLALKHMEQSLVASWLVNLKLEDPPVEAKGLSGKEAKNESVRRSVFLKIHTIRHRMVMNIQQILYYCFWDVVEPQWTRMAKLMKAATTVDDLCRIHKQHLDQIFHQCGLTARKLPKIMVELLKRARNFFMYVNKITSSKSRLLRIASTATSQKTVSGRVLAGINAGSSDPDVQYAELHETVVMLDRLDRCWNEQLVIFLSALNHYARKFEESYLTLAVRLDCYRGGEGPPGR
ncbi:gamma tubulin complex Spc97/GCP2 subunit Alp4 [Coemansia sp. RSA 1365]|nr:gamma tubulin complex Spc97/GCP2 subunit Alp4 [Coemansia sp. RSA 1365]